MCIIWISLGARSVTALYLRQWLTHARDVWMSHVTMGYLFKCQSSQRVFCDHLNVSASTTWMSRTLFKWHSTYSNVCHLNEYSVIIWMSPPPPFKCHAPYLNVVHTLFKCDSSYSNEVHLIVRMSLNVHPSHVCHPNEYPVLIIRMSLNVHRSSVCHLNMHHSSVCHPKEYPEHVISEVQPIAFGVSFLQSSHSINYLVLYVSFATFRWKATTLNRLRWKDAIEWHSRRAIDCTNEVFDAVLFIRCFIASVIIQCLSSEWLIDVALITSQDIVSFIGLFCKRDLSFEGAY